MRPGAEFFAVSHRAGAPMVAPAHGLINGTAPHSPWQSPVPYLFGGLAAMLGLIAFALLILACSYWKLSGYLDGDRDGQAAGDADGEKAAASGAARPALDFLEHVVVIMAGDERPTFLAKPAAGRAAEVELATAAAAASALAGGEGQEKKVDGQGSEASSHIGADSASPGRDHHETTSRSRVHDQDAAIQSGDRHQDDQDAASQSGDHHHDDQDAASQSRDHHHDDQDAASPSADHHHDDQDAASPSRDHHHDDQDAASQSSSTTALQESLQ